MAIETLDIAHEGLSVRHYDAAGQQLGGVYFFASGAAAMQCIPDNPPPAGTIARSGSIIILDNDGETEVARYNLRVVVLPFGIKSPRDSASGQATGRAIMKDGNNNVTLENYAFTVFSYEGLTLPVEALERVDVLGGDGTDAFAISEVGLFREGLRVSGGPNTRLAGTMANSEPGFWALPEVDDEVLLQFQAGGVPTGQGTEPPGAFNGMMSELAFPELDDMERSNFAMSLETERQVRRTHFKFRPGVERPARRLLV